MNGDNASVLQYPSYCKARRSLYPRDPETRSLL